VWEQVASQMRSKVDFKKLDGDDSSNDSLKAKYNVTGYPRLVFTDNSQAALLNHRGGFASAQDFINQISNFVR
jgi:thioredoxin-related protein